MAITKHIFASTCVKVFVSTCVYPLYSWEDGKPVGIDATIETSDGFRKSVIVADPRLPPGWVKHLARRTSGASAGKWDCIIVRLGGFVNFNANCVLDCCYKQLIF